MKTPIPLSAIVVLTCVSLAAAAAEEPALIARFVDPESPEAAEVRGIGERAINRLAITLVNEVAVAFRSANPATVFCDPRMTPPPPGTDCT